MALAESLEAADEAWEEDLVLSHHRMVRTPRENTIEFEVQHKAFHMALLAACHSPILLKFCDQLYDLNIRYRYLAGRTQGYTSRDIGKEHQEILAAALDRDVDYATTCLLQHYRRTGQFLSRRLSEQDFGSS